MDALIPLAEKLEDEVLSQLHQEALAKGYGEALVKEAVYVVKRNAFTDLKGLSEKEEVFKLSCLLADCFIARFAKYFLARIRQAEIDLEEKDRALLTVYLKIASPLHRFYTTWKANLYPKGFERPSPLRRRIVKTDPYFKNPYVLLRRTRSGYEWHTFATHPKLSRSAGRLADIFGSAQRSFGPDTPEHLYFTLLAKAFRTADPEEAWRLWRDIERVWIELDGGVLTPLLCEEDYDDRGFNIRRSPALDIEVQDTQYADVEARIRTLLQDLKQFYHERLGASPTACATVHTIDTLRFRIMHPILGAGLSAGLGTAAYVQPNDMELRQHVGFRCTLYMRKTIEALAERSIPSLKIFLRLLRGTRAAADTQNGEVYASHVARAFVIAAHEASHSLIANIPQRIFEEPKATYLGLYGLAHLYEQGLISSAEWESCVVAELARVVNSLGSYLDSKGNPNPNSALYPYQVENIILANRLVEHGAIDLSRKELRLERVSRAFTTLGEEIINILLDSKRDMAIRVFLERPEHRFLDVGLKELIVQVKREWDAGKRE